MTFVHLVVRRKNWNQKGNRTFQPEVLTDLPSENVCNQGGCLLSLLVAALWDRVSVSRLPLFRDATRRPREVLLLVLDVSAVIQFGISQPFLV